MNPTKLVKRKPKELSWCFFFFQMQNHPIVKELNVHTAVRNSHFLSQKVRQFGPNLKLGTNRDIYAVLLCDSVQTRWRNKRSKIKFRKSTIFFVWLDKSHGSSRRYFLSKSKPVWRLFKIIRCGGFIKVVELIKGFFLFKFLIKVWWKFFLNKWFYIKVFKGFCYRGSKRFFLIIIICFDRSKGFIKCFF